MNEKFENEYEQREQVDLDQIKVFRVRHGKSKYDELLKESIDADNSDLTKEGIESLERTAEKLVNELNPETDLVVIASSERRRAMASAEIIDKKLRDSGFEIWQDPRQMERNGKARNTRSKINDMEIIDKKTGEIIKPSSEKYWQASGDVWSKYLGENPEIPAKDVYPLWFNEELERLEGDNYKSDSKKELDQRSKNHLSFLQRVAQKFQPVLAKRNKRLVIIEVEHGESLDSLLKEMQNKNVDHGGFLELNIPTMGTEIDVRNWTNDKDEISNVKTINFDAKKRKFI